MKPPLRLGSDQHEPYSMSIPTASPWNSQSMPWTVSANTLNRVEHFNARSQFTVSKRTDYPKRKSDLEYELPKKQFINEEKISAHFNGMHISNNHPPQTDIGKHGSEDFFTGSSTMDYDFNPTIAARELEEKLRNANRITMCEEIRKLQSGSTAFLPSALFNRIEKPCTALVLWQPPPKLLCSSNSNKNIDIQLQNNTSDIEHDIDNNNSSNVDFNTINAPNEECGTVDGMDVEDL